MILYAAGTTIILLVLHIKSGVCYQTLSSLIHHVLSPPFGLPLVKNPEWRASINFLMDDATLFQGCWQWLRLHACSVCSLHGSYIHRGKLGLDNILVSAAPNSYTSWSLLCHYLKALSKLGVTVYNQSKLKAFLLYRELPPLRCHKLLALHVTS